MDLIEQVKNLVDENNELKEKMKEFDNIEKNAINKERERVQKEKEEEEENLWRNKCFIINLISIEVDKEKGDLYSLTGKDKHYCYEIMLKISRKDILDQIYFFECNGDKCRLEEKGAYCLSCNFNIKKWGDEELIEYATDNNLIHNEHIVSYKFTLLPSLPPNLLDTSS